MTALPDPTTTHVRTRPSVDVVQTAVDLLTDLMNDPAAPTHLFANLAVQLLTGDMTPTEALDAADATRH